MINKIWKQHSCTISFLRIMVLVFFHIFRDYFLTNAFFLNLWNLSIKNGYVTYILGDVQTKHDFLFCSCGYNYYKTNKTCARNSGFKQIGALFGIIISIIFLINVNTLANHVVLNWVPLIYQPSKCKIYSIAYGIYENVLFVFSDN